MTVNPCERHRKYQLSCEAYAALTARAAGRCEVCGTSAQRLGIDHDHSVGDHAVRGLVCPACNSFLDRIDKGTERPRPEHVRYLSAPFWRTLPHPGVYQIYWSPKGGLGDGTHDRRFAIPDELWPAGESSESLSAAVRRALEEYVK